MPKQQLTTEQKKQLKDLISWFDEEIVSLNRRKKEIISKYHTSLDKNKMSKLTKRIAKIES